MDNDAESKYKEHEDTNKNKVIVYVISLLSNNGIKYKETEEVNTKNPSTSEIKEPGIGWRHYQSLLLFTGLLLAFSMRVNMSMAIVAMTDPSDPHSFKWSVGTQSVILSSFYWGMIVLQIPGGELAARWGGKVLVAISLGVNSLAALAVPFAAYYGGWQVVCACCVLQGLSQGFIMPAYHNMIGKWVPLEEKSRLGTFIYTGGQCGTALQLMSSGFVIARLGWPAMFYINGSIGVLWTILFLVYGAASPQTCKRISDHERMYIQTSLGQVGVQKRLSTPWRSIATSVPFLSLIIVHCGQNWGFCTLMTLIPSYFKLVLGVDIKSNGMLSALPYVAMTLMCFPFAFFADYALKKKWLSVTAVRKISNSIGLYGPAVALIGLSYAPAGNVAVASAILTVVVGLNAGHNTGLLLVHIDMSPNFAGTLMGISNFFAALVAIMAPIAAGLILKDETSAADWRKVFYLSSAVYVVCNTIYVLLGTSERQPWNEPKDEADGDTPIFKQGLEDACEPHSPVSPNHTINVNSTLESKNNASVDA